MEAEKARIENLRLDVEIKTIPSRYAAVLRRIGGLDESEIALARLKQLLDEARIEPTGYPFGRFISDSDDVPLEEFVWEIGYPIPPGTQVDPPLEIIQVSELQVASATIEGIEHTEEVWPKFVRAVSDFGFVPSGLPVFEIWKGEPEGQEFWWKTEMLIMAFDIDEGYPGMEISFKETEPFTAFILPMHGSYAQLANATRLLKKIVEEKRIRTTGPPFGRYFTDGSKVLPSQYVWEIGYPVEEGTTADPPFVVRKIEGAKVASTTLLGPPEPDYPWGPFIFQIMIEGYVPALPAVEIWHGDPRQSGPEGPRMELQIPVFDSGDIGDIGEAISRIVQESLGGPSTNAPQEESPSKEPTRISTDL